MVASRRGRQSARKFFSDRRPVGPFSVHSFEGAGQVVEYPNVTKRIGALLSHDKSLIGPLTTTLGLSDMYDLLEVIAVDNHNDHVVRKAREDRNR